MDLVLIHGMWSTGGNWARVRTLLEEAGCRCHVPTLPAHEVGREHPEVGTIGVRDFLQYLRDFVHRLGLAQPPVYVGHSMGGLLAQQLAALDGAQALMLLTPAAPAGINGLRLANAIAFSRALSRPGFWRKPHKPRPRRASVSVFNGVPMPRHPALYATLVPESGRAAFELGFWYLDRSRASDVDHASVQCPVYVVSCGRDRLTPAPVVRKVAALYPGAALRHFPQRGHWVIDDDDTEDMVNDMLIWLRALDRRTQARGLRRA